MLWNGVEGSNDGWGVAMCIGEGKDGFDEC